MSKMHSMTSDFDLDFDLSILIDSTTELSISSYY